MIAGCLACSSPFTMTHGSWFSGAGSAFRREIRGNWISFPTGNCATDVFHTGTMRRLRDDWSANSPPTSTGGSTVIHVGAWIGAINV